ncbi:MAG: dipeptidase [Rhodospirillales bacterium]|nr:MAG: dipeptidase [Rhodospirillales bacterium]
MGALCVAALLGGCGAVVDRLLNRVYEAPPYEVEAATQELYRRQLVVDLHGDILLWRRDLLERAGHGHVDLPRLQEGNVALQVFGVVTQVPFTFSLDNNKPTPDVISALAWSDDWPAETRDSRLERALYQADKLADRIARSDGALTLVTDRAELEALIAARRGGAPVIGAILLLEGAQALDGELANIDRLYDAGFRIVGLSHLFDNDMAGSAHGTEKHGLTPQGRELVRRLQEKRMIIDLAHASPQAFDEVIAMARGPVIASHGGVRGTCDTNRNLSDDQVRAIAGTGGLVGIGVYRYATCGKTVADTVRAMRHVADLVGVSHVALGSDFDGAVATVFDTTGWPLLVEALLADGFSEAEIAAILGGNALRVLREALP